MRLEASYPIMYSAGAAADGNARKEHKKGNINKPTHLEAIAGEWSFCQPPTSREARGKTGPMEDR